MLVQGPRSKVQGSRFKVQGSRFKVQGSRCHSSAVVLCPTGAMSFSPRSRDTWSGATWPAIGSPKGSAGGWWGTAPDSFNATGFVFRISIWKPIQSISHKAKQPRRGWPIFVNFPMVALSRNHGRGDEIPWGSINYRPPPYLPPARQVHPISNPIRCYPCSEPEVLPMF